MIPYEPSHDFDDLLDRYAADECTLVEQERVGQWLASDPAPPARLERLARFQKVWAATRLPRADVGGEWDVDAAWRRATPKLVPPKVLTLTSTKAGRSSLGKRFALGAVAATVLLTGATLWTVRHMMIPGEERVATAGRTYATAAGERMALTLVDGTRVTLGAASTLLVPDTYQSDTARLVRLDGEGYFDVAPQAHRPFAVLAHHGLVRDIGTSFVVRAYAADRPVVVAVTQGEVLLGAERLREGDLGHLDAGGAVRVRRGVDLRSYTSWLDGRLVFEDTPLDEALPILEHWYGLQIIVADSTLYERRLFAVLDHEPVARVLDLLALSLDARVEQQNNVVTILR